MNEKKKKFRKLIYLFVNIELIKFSNGILQMLPGHERTRIDEPMDTIFVKQVRVNSPAAEAGLRTGDRVVSVDGIPTRGEQYASVVQRIQQAGPWLRLLVVSKEDDILQRV